MGGNLKKRDAQAPYGASPQMWNMQGILAQEAQRKVAARSAAPQAAAHDGQDDAEIVDMDNAPYRESALEESLRDLRGTRKGGLMGYLGIGAIRTSSKPSSTRRRRPSI